MTDQILLKELVWIGSSKRDYVEFPGEVKDVMGYALYLAQEGSAQLMGIAQPDLSNILRGRFRGYSVERLMRFLTALTWLKRRASMMS
jgi:Helix-turn-helix domain